jgi:putative membrane protein
MTDTDPTLWTLFLGTLALRPYVFVFLVVYLFSNTLVFGFVHTLLFTIGGYTLVFLAEFCSTRTGFPFGFYYYIDTTRQQELWLSDVPLMDSLSFTFLAHASYMTALFLCAPLWRRRSDVQIVDTKAIRRSPSVLVLAVTLFVLLDIVIDPVALRGSRWFLGQIYGYYEEGVYFGVPLANFLGWAIVGLGLITLHRLLDGVYRARPRRAWGAVWMPYRGLLGPLLYLGVFGFNVAIAFLIGEYMLGVVDLFLLGPLSILAWTQVERPSNRATPDDLAAHYEDFPTSPLRRRLQASAS